MNPPKRQPDPPVHAAHAAPVTAAAPAPATAGGSGQDAPLSAVQQRFNHLLAKIGKLEGQLTELQALADAFRPLYHGTLEPLRQAHRALMRRMALVLDERLQRTGLSPAQKRNGLDILCGLCATLAGLGDQAMAALHDQPSLRTLRQKAQEQVDLMRSMVEQALGGPLDLPPQDDAPGSPDPLEAVARASRERLQEAMQAEAAAREAAQARKKTKKPTPVQHKAAQQQEDADSVLRQVYRQLASALHPDRERDPAEQQRKTALMSQANAAYARQDLLHLQLQIAQADAQSLLRQPEERIAAMSRLLQQQADELQQELLARRRHLQGEFDLDLYEVPTAAMLRCQLEQDAQGLKDELAFMESDLTLVQNDAGLKRWLKEQAKMNRRTTDYF